MQRSVVTTQNGRDATMPRSAQSLPSIAMATYSQNFTSADWLHVYEPPLSQATGSTYVVQPGAAERSAATTRGRERPILRSSYEQERGPATCHPGEVQNANASSR